MTEEHWIRKDIKKDSSRILYEDERYLVGVSNSEIDAHHLLVENGYAYLPRGIFGELARANALRLRSSLSMIAQEILEVMTQKEIPIEELGWTLAKAAIKDQEDYANRLFEQRDSE